MDPDDGEVLAALTRLADASGPAIVPVGHRELLRTITETCRRLFDAQACSLALLTGDGSELEFIMASGTGAEAVSELRLPASQGIAGWVVMSGQAIAVDDVARDTRFAAGVAQATGYVPRSILAMPLQTERRVLGVIEVLDRGERSKAPMAGMELLSLFASVASLAIESSAVFSEMGRALLLSLAETTPDADLAAALRERARSAPAEQRDLAEVASLLQQLGEAGERERRFAVRLLSSVLDHVRTRPLE